MRDALGPTLGNWEAKDTADDLDREIRKKIESGYSLQDTIFRSPNRAVLYQDGLKVQEADLSEHERLGEVIRAFRGYREPEIERFHEAVAELKRRISDLASGLVDRTEEARQSDPGAALEL